MHGYSDICLLKHYNKTMSVVILYICVFIITFMNVLVSLCHVLETYFSY